MMNWRIVYVKVRADGVHYKLECTKPIKREVTGRSTEPMENVVKQLFKSVKRLNLTARHKWGIQIC